MIPWGAILTHLCLPPANKWPGGMVQRDSPLDTLLVVWHEGGAPSIYGLLLVQIIVWATTSGGVGCSQRRVGDPFLDGGSPHLLSRATKKENEGVHPVSSRGAAKDVGGT